ncbi:MAG TPA: VOC family protein [Tepidiformaceae bacterium]|nr:VOC family protein [Tepidiformaceae bacterium]
MFTGVEAVVLVVEDLDASIAHFKDIYGVDHTPIGEPPGAGFRNTFFRFPNSGDVELVAPTGADGPVAKRLASSGPGVYMLTMTTDNLAATLEKLRAKGVRLIGDPGPGKEPAGQVFIHPASAGGVLTQIVQH